MTPEESEKVIKIVDNHVRFITGEIEQLKIYYKDRLDIYLNDVKKIMFDTVKKMDAHMIERINQLESKLFLLEKKLG